MVLGFTFDTVADWLANPEPIDFGLGLLIGVLLLWVAWCSREKDERRRSEARVDGCRR